jgi:ABC-type sugar transport system substrate-binding protein
MQNDNYPNNTNQLASLSAAILAIIAEPLRELVREEIRAASIAIDHEQVQKLARDEIADAFSGNGAARNTISEIVDEVTSSRAYLRGIARDAAAQIDIEETVREVISNDSDIVRDALDFDEIAEQVKGKIDEDTDNTDTEKLARAVVGHLADMIGGVR